MASFGRFESVRELHRTGFNVVYSGRTAASTEEKFALKVCQPSVLILSEDQVKTETRRFLDSAGIQQKVVEGGAQYWAPIHQSGSSPEGTFYVTDKYDRSLQQLIDGRVKVSAQVLLTIIQSIVKGLNELKEKCGRPHGNLKATNVLIVGTGDISQTKIVLSDPLSDEQIDKKVHWDSDLRAIGKFIYELITHRQTPSMRGWQVPDSEGWSSLVKQAKSWKNLCNMLLGAGIKAGTADIETVATILDEIEKAKPALSYKWIIAGGLVLIVCVVALVALLRRPPPPEKTEWENLCNQYMAWIDDFRKDLAQQQVDWSQDERLAPISDKVALASYPYKVMVNQGMGSINEIVSHPEYAEQAQTQDALAAIEDINGVLDPNSPKAWFALARMSSTANKFKDRGWRGPASYLRNLVEGVKPEPNKPIVDNINTIIELGQKGILENIDLSLKKIADYQNAIKNSRDPILVKLDDDYVTNQAAGAANINELNDKLATIVQLNERIKKFVEVDWQTNIDQEAFLAEHSGDTLPETLTDSTFTTRLDVFETYRYIRPDPREKLIALVGQIEQALPIAIASNPVEANPCSQEFDKFKSEIDTVRKIKGIEKNRTEITEAINNYTPKLQKLEARIAAATETTQEYYKRIQNIAAIAKSEKINNKWSVQRDSLFNKYPENEIRQDMRKYADLRRKMDATEKELLKLDEELQEKLYTRIEIPQDQTGWHSKVKQAYDLQREEVFGRIVDELPVLNDIPDINEQKFTESKQAKITALEQTRRDLASIVTAFDAIEEALDACYLIDDQLPKLVQDTGSVRTLWDKWKNSDILKKPEFATAFAEPIAQITELEKIDAIENRQTLIDTALSSVSKREVIYAAWTKLDHLSDPPWPDNYKELGNDRQARQKLRTEFETISRKNELLDKLLKTAIRHEIVLIKRNSSEDKILAGFDQFATEASSSYSQSELENLEALSITLVDYVCEEDWQNDKIRKDLFFQNSNIHNSQSPVTMQTYRDWLTEVEDYKQLTEDPRKQYPWQEKITEITQLVEKELGRKQDSSTAETAEESGKGFLGTRLNDISKLINTVGGTLTGPSKQNLEKLEQEYTRFVSTTQTVKALLDMPAIEKNKDKIDADTCKNLWEKLVAHETAVRSIIKPEYCKHLELLEGETRRLVFDNLTELSTDFEPINISRLSSVTENRTIIDKGFDILRQVKDTAKTILSQSNLKDLFNKTVQITDWEQIRKSVKDGQTEWLDFFQTTDTSDARNVGWPKYIVSKKDPSIILRFIPASTANPEPFYMSIHEISNSQYRLFLEDSGAKKGGPPLAGWSLYNDQNNVRLIHCTSTDAPSTAIKWDSSSNKFVVAEADADTPVTWVTFQGAQKYAAWLGGMLPTALQHQYACRANTGSIRPWGNNASAIADYAHVRGAAWKTAAEDWNRRKDSKVPPLPVAPIGAIEDYQDNNILNPDAIVITSDPYNTVWPTTGAGKGNAWGLHDMIGNVWEWCQNDADNTRSVICGGSCLSPSQYILLDSPANYQVEFDLRDNDVGFRVIVPAK